MRGVPLMVIGRYYAFSSLIVILPFLAVSTTLRALLIIPIPNFDNSADEMVSSLGFDFDIFVFILFDW